MMKKLKNINFEEYAKKSSENSRTKNTFFNFVTSIGGQVLALVLQFVIRTVFVYTLGKAYLGINGLFSNILSMLTLADMGVGTAIVYKLYKPIADDDYNTIVVYVNFYKTIYRIIGVIIAALGVCLIPFLPILINDYDLLADLGLNGAFVFCLYLFNTISSYLFFAYRSSILRANQKEYIITIVGYFFTITAAIAQIVCLIVLKDFIIYVIITILQTIFMNIVIGYVSGKMYPYLNAKTNNRLSKKEKKIIFKDCSSLLIYNISNVVNKSADNIILSAFIGLEIVAEYSNYLVIYTTIHALIIKIFTSISHSIGNLVAEGDSKNAYSVFRKTTFISAIMGSVCLVGIGAVADELVEAWIGKEWVLGTWTSILIGMELFTLTAKQAVAKFRFGYGLFTKGKFRPAIGVALNVIISIVLVKPLGIIGVLLGTVTSEWLTTVWFEPYIVFKYGFKNEFSLARYFFDFGKWFLTSAIMLVANIFIVKNFFVGYGWLSVIVHAIISLFTTFGALMLVSLGTSEEKYVASMIKNTILSVKSKIKK